MPIALILAALGGLAYVLLRKTPTEKADAGLSVTADPGTISKALDETKAGEESKAVETAARLAAAAVTYEAAGGALAPTVLAYAVPWLAAILAPLALRERAIIEDLLSQMSPEQQQLWHDEVFIYRGLHFAGRRFLVLGDIRKVEIAQWALRQ